MKRELTLLIDGVAVTVTAERRGDRIVVQRDGEEHEIVVTGDRIVVPGEAGPPAGSSKMETAGALSTGAEHGADAHSAGPQPAAGSQAKGAEGDVRAPMVGVVREIHAKQGATVHAGDLIITMEAMKMDIYVNAPVTGTVAAVLCTAGETASEGSVLATVTPAASGGGS